MNEARLTDVYLDDGGVMHLAFWGGNGTDADIYYSQSPVAEVGNPRAWSKPIIIGDQAGDPEGAVFAQPAGGDLVVIFHGRQYGNGIYVVSSKDRGSTWSFPTPIFITRDEAPNVAYLEVLKSNSGWLHLIWNVYSLNGQGRGIYYARSADGEVWDQPTVFAEADEGLGTQTPTIIEHDNSLFAFYNLPPKIIMQRSLDDGKTWQDPAILFPRHVGVNGSLSPVVDANDTLHLFFGQRISGNPDIHGLWHSVWVDPRWSEPEAIIKGPQVNDLIGRSSFDPYAARAVVSRGNVILVTWRTDPGNKGNGVWFSYETIAAPGSPTSFSSPVPPELIEGTPTSIPEVNNQNLSPLNTAPPDNPLPVDNTIKSIAWSPSPILLISLAVVFVVLLVRVLTLRKKS
jgi:hypothetical protein